MYFLNTRRLLNLIKDSKSKAFKKSLEFLICSKDSIQFWHRYHQVLGTKKDNAIEPLCDNTSTTFIFKDNISNIPYNYHINKEKENIKYNFFKAKINGELENIISKSILSEPYVFLDETQVKAAIKGLDKNFPLVLIE